METVPNDKPPLCPSCQPEMDSAIVFGVIGGTAVAPQVAYLERPTPATPALRILPNLIKPTEVYRMAAPCAGRRCQHFDGADCQLAKRIVQILPAVVDVLPPCRIRPGCRWWQQEGRAACLRCPQVVTDVFNPTDGLMRAAGPQPASAL